jgi:hypothetical protein
VSTFARRVLYAALAGSFGCSAQDAEVGWNPAPVHEDAGSEANLPGPTLVTEFASDEGLWDLQMFGAGAANAFGQPSPSSGDGAVATLTFPGHPGWTGDQNAGPHFATQIAMKQLLGYGTYRTRIEPATCNPTEEVVSSFFVFFNDGSDANGNGLVDNREIDMQFPCGTPSIVSMSTWTDYQAGAGGKEQFIKLTREVDTATGDYYDTASDRSDALSKTGTSAEFQHPEFPKPGSFYEIGFDWHPSALRFFIVWIGQEITLFELSGDARVPGPPIRLMYNIWHPPEHWFPIDVADTPGYPSADAVMRVDRLEYWAD